MLDLPKDLETTADFCLLARFAPAFYCRGERCREGTIAPASRPKNLRHINGSAGALRFHSP
jgi:hypothetical protein